MTNHAYTVAPRKVRASVTRLPNGPKGLVLGNTTRIDSGLRNVQVHNAYVHLTRAEQAGIAKAELNGKVSFGGYVYDADGNEIRQDRNTDDIQARAPYSAHTTSGEDASRSTSVHWAVTKEIASPTRQAVEAIRANNPDLTYRAAHALYKAALDHAAALNAEKIAADKRAQESRIRRSHRSKGARRNAARKAQS